MESTQNTGTKPTTTTEVMDRLVSFDTTSRNSKLPLIGFIREYVDGLGVPYCVSSDVNLGAVIGPQQAGGLALSGHVAIVPVDGQASTVILSRFASGMTGCMAAAT